MASRPRDKRRKNWPDYLHAKERNGPYYFWRHPGTGQEFGLGRNFNDAAAQAIEANMKLRGNLADRRLTDKLSDEGSGTVSEFIPIFRAIVVSRGVAPNTLKTLGAKLRAIDAAIGPMVMRKVTTEDLNDKLAEPFAIQGKDRMLGSIKSTLNDMWLEAAGKGKVDSNPVALLRIKAATVKRERLTLEQFKVIYAKAQAMPDRWASNMMRLALVTAQPRECLVRWEFSDCRDGFLWNERGKTGARVKLPLDLEVPGLGWTLAESVKLCRDSVLSRHMLHHNIKRTKAAPGDPVSLNTATKGFARARDSADLTWPDGKAPPSLHEIRSLALRLYKDAHGRDFAQALAAHKQGSTTDIYTDVRGAEWIEVRGQVRGQ